MTTQEQPSADATAAEVAGGAVTAVTAVTAPAAKFWDEKNSVVCPRCGGTGMYPSAAYNGICLKCRKRGFVPILPKGQAAIVRRLQKQGVRLVELAEATVGDLVLLEKTASLVTSITWRKPSNKFMASLDNQWVHLERVIDGAKGRTARVVMYLPAEEDATGWTIHKREDGSEYRTVTRQYVPVSEAMRGQEATQDASGAWIRF